MSRVIDFAEIRPGMVIYREERPRRPYPPVWNLSWELEPLYIDERDVNGVVHFHVDYFTETGRGRILGPSPAVRYWDGAPTWGERTGTPWEVVKP